jgi:hypothetical protein
MALPTAQARKTDMIMQDGRSLAMDIIRKQDAEQKVALCVAANLTAYVVCGSKASPSSIDGCRSISAMPR